MRWDGEVISCWWFGVDGTGTVEWWSEGWVRRWGGNLFPRRASNSRGISQKLRSRRRPPSFFVESLLFYLQKINLKLQIDKQKRNKVKISINSILRHYQNNWNLIWYCINTLWNVNINRRWLGVGGFTCVITRIYNKEYRKYFCIVLISRKWRIKLIWPGFPFTCDPGIANGQSGMSFTPRFCVNSHFSRVPVVYHPVIVIPEN